MKRVFVIIVLTILLAISLQPFNTNIALAQDGESQSFSVEGNTVSFDSSVDPGDIGYTYSTGFQSTLNTEGDFGSGVTVTGPEGTIGVVTSNPDGTFTVDFQYPGGNGDIGSSPAAIEISGEVGSGNSGNSGSGGGDTFSVEAPDPGGNTSGSPPVLDASTFCNGLSPQVHLTWTGDPIYTQGGWIREWRLLKSGIIGTYRSTDPSELFFRDLSYSNYQVLENTVYLYRVYGFDGGARRTPLSNIMVVVTPSCAPSGDNPINFGSGYTLTGYVYSDENNNGGYDTGADVGVPGETVQLLNNSNGAVLAQVVTNGVGFYTINNVASGGYTVRHVREPLWPQWIRTTARDLVVAVSSNTSANFGMRAFLPVYVFKDENRNGNFDAGDSPLWMETVRLLNNSNGAVTAEVQTDANGYSPFSLVPYYGGGYTIRHLKTLPAGWMRTTSQDQVRSMSNLQPVYFGLDDQPVSATPVSVSLTLNGQVSGDTIGVYVNQNGEANLSWTCTNTTGNICTAEVVTADGTVPAALNTSWSGSKGPSGNTVLSTTTAGTFLIKLTGTNADGTEVASIPLHIRPYPPPYFQTTGGDIHTNESITVPRP